MNKIFSISILAIFACLLVKPSTVTAQQQCAIENNFFQAGENLTYDLYIKLGITVKGGYANLSTRSVQYDGKDAYKMTLVSESQGLARKAFELNDTLACFMTKDLIPLAYHKDAHEGGDHTIERQKYSYSGNTVKINSVRHKNGEFKFDENLEFSSCAYDLMSILFYARTLDYENMTKGAERTVNFVSGKKKVSMRIVYDGKDQMKANDGKKYNCMKLTLYIHDEAFDGGKEAMKVYISDDANRLPIRLDTKLKVGSTRAVLKSYKGNRHPLNVAR